MHDELTAVDIKKMQDEVDYRMCVLRPQLLAEVQRTREFGDLSENAEYKEAKREKNKNESRIRYLKNMIATAKVIKVDQKEDAVCLFDTVAYYIEEDDEVVERKLVTTLRAGSLPQAIAANGIIGSRNIILRSAQLFGTLLQVCLRLCMPFLAGCQIILQLG